MISTREIMAEYNLAAGLTVDGAYYFTPVIGVLAELGYDVAYFKIGLSIKPGAKS